ncbi:tetratricopeptide repeat protein [Aliikangiella marina]|nr:tetratricopeptide repeat protein [Aliikangiella marina]
MKKYLVKNLIIAASVSGLLAACVSTKQDSLNTPHNEYQFADISHLDNRQKADLYEAIIAADIAEHQQDFQTATSYYLYAADASQSIELIKKSVASAQAAQDPLALEQATLMWLQKEPDNLSAQSMILQSQLAQQNAVSALDNAKKFMAMLETSEQKLSLIEMSIVPQEPRIAFNLLRELQNQMPKEVAIPTGISKLFMRLAAKSKQPENILTQALSHAEDALEINPLFYPAIRNKSHVLVQLGRDDAARNYLNDLFNRNPTSTEISLMLGQLLYDLQDYQASIAHFTDWLMNKPNDQESRFYLAASYYALGEVESGYPHFVLLAESGYRLDKVAFYCGDSAMKVEETEQAIQCFEMVNEGRFQAHAKVFLSKLYAEKGELEKALASLANNPYFNENDQIKLINAEIDLLLQYFSREQAQAKLSEALTEYPQNLVLLLKKIELFELQDKPNELMTVLTEARDVFDENDRLIDFNLAAAALLNNHNHSQLAVEWLNQALEKTPDDKDLLYTRALYKEPLGLYDEMVDEFKHLHKLYPEDLNIQNALGYTLADLNRELDYANSLINAAFQGLPNNPAVIDSKGWIAFRLGKMTEAIQYLTRAFKMAPSADIAAHLGEVLWVNDQKELAIKVWQEGLELERDSSVLLKTLERLKISL